jgi:MFS family permease
VAALFFGVAASSMGYTMIVALLPLAAEDLLGSPRWSGVPSSLATTGVALGTTYLATLMARRGRRGPLLLGYWGAAAAAGVAAIGAGLGTFLVLATAIFFVGAGHSANRLSRYAAADLHEPVHRSAAIGWNVWAATIGAVVGPLLLEPTRRLGVSLGATDMVGPFVLAAVTFVASALVLGRMYAPDVQAPDQTPSEHADRTLVSASRLRLAVVSLVAGQVVMVLIMTMTPVHIRGGGYGLESVGVVFAAHTFGMFAFSPVAGLLSDRFGRRPMIVLACTILSAAGLLAASADAGSASLTFALFLLGLGWSLSFVSASALLTESLEPSRRVRFQGVADSFVWGSAAVAGLASGILLSEVGYSTLSHIGAALALLPLLFLRRR